MIEEGTIGKLEIEDGDCLVLTTPKRLCAQERTHIWEGATYILDKLGKDARVIILEDGMTASILKTSQLQAAA